MIATLRRKISLALLALALVLPALSLATPQAVYAETSKAAACEGIGLTGSNCGGSAGSQVSDLVTTVVKILSWVVGVAAVIMIIVAGFKYITSGGDSSGVASAKNTLIYAIVGLVVVALSQFIVHFVLKHAK